LASQFSGERRADILEVIRRLVAEVLVGNDDNYLKKRQSRA